MKREFLCVVPSTGTAAKSSSWSGDQDTGWITLAVVEWRMASTLADHSARSPPRTRSDNSSQSPASRQPVSGVGSGGRAAAGAGVVVVAGGRAAVRRGWGVLVGRGVEGDLAASEV